MVLTEEAKVKIGRTIETALDKAGIARNNSAKALNVTPSTLTGFLRGISNYKINLGINAAALVGMRFDELSNLTRKVWPSNFRDVLIDFHKFINSEAYPFISGRPTYKFAITQWAIKGNMEDYNEAGTIISGIDVMFKFEEVPESISNELRELVQENVLESIPHRKRANRFEYRKSPSFLENNVGTNYYIPSYIKLSLELTRPVSFEILFRQSLILLKLSEKPQTGKQLFHSVDQLSFSKSNVKTFLQPLVEGELITAENVSGKDDFVYGITDKGRDVLNLG